MIGQEQSLNQYQYVIIGAGISGLQAALILAEHDKEFIILEADNRIGGRICSESIKEVIKQKCYDYDFQWFNNMTDFHTDFGATWVAENQSFMKKLTSDFGMNLFTQNYQALNVLAINENEYHRLPDLGQYFNQYPQIVKMLKDIQVLYAKIEYFNAQRSKQQITEQQIREEQQLYTKYINMTGQDFINSVITDKALASLLGKQYVSLLCTQTHKINALQLIMNYDNFDTVNHYVGLKDQNIDGFRAKEGMHTICRSFIKEIQKVFDNKKNSKDIEKLIKFNHPVKKILNDEKPVQIVLENGEIFKCSKAITCLPLATMGRIEYENISVGKKIIIQDTVECNITRMSMVFKSTFWRPQYSGYMSFSDKFLPNQLVDLSPQANQCGILAYVFTGEGFANWNKQVLTECQLLEGQNLKKQWYQVNKRKALKILADIFFKGDLENQNLKEAIVFHKSMSQSKYIKSSYQGISSPATTEKLFNLGLDFEKNMTSDEKNMIILGSDFADNEFMGYMQGALRFSRKKIYAELKEQDPLHELLSEQ